MKKNNRKGISIVEIFVICAIIAIITALLMPVFQRVYTKGHFQENDLICVKTFEKNNGKYSSDLIVVFEKPDNKTITLECNLGIYAQINEGKQYDISYELYNTNYNGVDGVLRKAVKVYKSQKDKE